MALDGPYREHQALSTALPWSRRHLHGWTIAIVAVGILAVALAVVAPFLFLASSASPTDLGAGGVGMLVLAGYLVAVFPTVTILGIKGLRGRRIAPGIPVALALSPLAVALLFAARAAIAAATADRTDLSPRLAATTAGEIQATMLFGALIAAGACAIVATSAIGALASVDGERYGVKPGPVWTTLLIGGAWFLVSFAVRVLAARLSGPTLLLLGAFALPLGAVALAAIAAFSAGVLEKAEDLDEGRSAFGHLVAAIVTTTACVLLVGRAMSSALEMSAFLESARETVQPERRATLLADLSSARASQAFTAIVDVVGCVACFAVPLGAAARAGRRLVTRTLIVPALAGAVALAVAVAHGRIASGARARLTGEPALVLPQGFAVPAAPPESPTYRSRPEGRVLVDASGRVTGTSDDNFCEIVADRRVRFGLVAANAFSSRPLGFHCLLLAGPTDFDRAALGEYDSLVDVVTYGFPVYVMPRGPVGITPPVLLEITIEEAPFIRVGVRAFARVQMIDLTDRARGEALRAIASPAVQGVRVVARDSDTMGRLVEVVAVVANALPAATRGKNAIEITTRR